MASCGEGASCENRRAFAPSAQAQAMIISKWRFRFTFRLLIPVVHSPGLLWLCVWHSLGSSVAEIKPA
jgi:hypothetical protein